MIAFVGSIGGLAAPVGTPPNLIALAALREHAGIGLTFVPWMQLALPLSLVMLAFLSWLMRSPAGPAIGNAAETRSQFRSQLTALGPMMRGERYVAGALGTAVFLWVYPGAGEQLGFGGNPLPVWIRRHFPEGIIGLLTGLVLLALPANFRKWEFALEWSEAAKIDGGSILPFAGGLSLGAQIFQTGLAKAIGDVEWGRRWAGRPGGPWWPWRSRPA